MKRIKKRLDELTNVVLDSKSLTKEECEAAQSELKVLRELIQTRKAYSVYVEDYGDEAENEPRQKRTSNTQWD